MEQKNNIAFWAYSQDNKVSGKVSGDVELLDNVQFIYELSLAELELQVMGAEF